MSTHVPIRTCAGCRQRQPLSTLVRLTASAAGGIRVTGVLGGRVAAAKVTEHRDSSGRGLYTCPDLRCASRALRPIRGRLKIEMTADRLAARALCQATSLAKGRFERRESGLARRGLAVQDARLRAWGKTLTRLDAVAQTAFDSGVQ